MDTSVQKHAETPYRRYRASDVQAFEGTLGNLRRLGDAVVREGDLPDLALMVELHRDLDDSIGRAVAGFRAKGMSWADIAAGFGVSRSAAFERWSERARP